MKTNKVRVCLITTNHISTNPRLVKECIALENAGADIFVIFTQFDPFLSKLDDSILNAHPQWNYTVLNWRGNTISSFIARIKGKFLNQLSNQLFRIFRREVFANLVLNRHYFWQLKTAKQIKADIYIAHNLGALPVAVAAKNTNSKAGFDAEDFHRHEIADNSKDKEVVVRKFIEEKNLPLIDYFTAASPLIAKRYNELFPSLNSNHVILNVFSKNNLFERFFKTDKRIKLFWFSQTIGPDRGIEDIILALSKIRNNNFELHLLGKPTLRYTKEVRMLAKKSGLRSKITFHGYVPEAEIFRFASTCDIGLASETGVPHNRDICLTNKIFTYIQSGLAVIASDTTAQRDFLDQYPQVGKLYCRKDLSTLVSILEFFSKNRDFLEACKVANYELGQTLLNWEIEQEKFLCYLNDALKISSVK